MANVLKIASSRKYPFTVLIEGNIGAGKTTLLNHFKKNDDISLFTEPVEKWRNIRGFNCDGEKWAFPFQSYATLTMLQIHTASTPKRVKIMERSLYSARYCFVEAMLANNSLHKGMFDILQEWYKYIDEKVHIQADLIVYLRTTPETAQAHEYPRSRRGSNRPT